VPRHIGPLTLDRGGGPPKRVNKLIPMEASGALVLSTTGRGSIGVIPTSRTDLLDAVDQAVNDLKSIPRGELQGPISLAPARSNRQR
jgi:hypothetical protein